MDEPITVRQIRNALRKYRFAHANEIELHTGIEKVLKDLRLDVQREVRLSDKDRIDIMTDLPRPDRPVRVGIEVKVKGPADAVLRQLVRYAGHDQVGALILVTTLYRHMTEVARHTRESASVDAGARMVLAGKPFEIVLLSRGML